jgi:hypothetical protein
MNHRSFGRGLTRHSTRTPRGQRFAPARRTPVNLHVGPHGTVNRRSLVRRHACVCAFGSIGSVHLVAVRWRTGRRVARCCRRWSQRLVSGQPVIGSRAAAKPRSAGRSLRCAGAGSTVHSRTATSSVGAVARNQRSRIIGRRGCLLRAAALWCLARRRIIVIATAVRPNPAFNTDARWAALRARPPVAG